MALTLSPDQRRGMVVTLMGSLFCLAMFWFLIVDEPGGLQNEVVFAGATVTFALCALVAGGALLFDRIGPPETAN